MIESSFYQTLHYRSTVRPADLLADLTQLDTIRTIHKGKRARWIMGVVACLLLAGGGLLGLLTVGKHSTGGVQGGLGGALALGIVGAVVCGIAAYRAGRLILDQRRYGLAQETLRHLACDMPKEETVTLALDFNAYKQNCYRTATGKSGFYGVSSYEQPWLLLEGAFLDGNHFRLETALLSKRKERSKKKYTKVKELLWEQITLTMKVKAKHSENLQPWPDFLKTAPLPEQVFLKKVRVDGPRVTLQAETKRQLRTQDRSGTTNKDAEKQLADGHVLLKLCLASYHALGQCRPTQRGA